MCPTERYWCTPSRWAQTAADRIRIRSCLDKDPEWTVISPQNVYVNGMPHYVRNLRSVIDSTTSESGKDKELSTQSAGTIIIIDALSDPPEVGNPDATDETSADESSEEEETLARRSAQEA